MTEIAAADESSNRPEDLIAFTLGDRTVRVGEAVRAAHFRHDLQAHWLDLVQKIACEEHASGQELEPDSEALQAVADQFRYGRDLITTEETEQWLELRGLDADDFLTHISRTYWKQTLGNELAAPSDVFFAAGSEQRAQLTVELLLTGAFNRLARDLAWRLAAYRPDDASADTLPARIEKERTRFFARTGLDPDSLPAWLERVEGDGAWFEEMLAMEAAYSRRCEELVTPERMTRELRSQRLALMRFEVEEIEFDTMEAAREAVLCVRTDGLSMEEVARESRYPYARHEFVQEDLPEVWQVPLLSTAEGSLAGPFVDGDLIRLFRIVRKIEPTVDDPSIRPRLEQRVLESSFVELCAAQGYKAVLG